MVKEKTMKKIYEWFLTIVDLENKEVLYAYLVTDSHMIKTRNEIK